MHHKNKYPLSILNSAFHNTLIVSQDQTKFYKQHN